MLQEYQLLYLDNDIPINKSFYCNNGDIKARGLEVHVLDNSVAKDCTGLELRMIVKVPSGEMFEATVANGLVTVLNVTGGIYQVLFPNNMGKGRLTAEIQLSNTVPEVIVSRKFSILGDGSLTSDGNISVLPGAGMLAPIIVAEPERVAAEVLRKTDEAARKTAETTRAGFYTGFDSSLAAVTNRVDDIITTPVPVGEVIAQEIIDARQGTGSVGTNITDVKAKLAEVTERQGMPNGNMTVDVNEAHCINADTPLNIPSYVGDVDNEVTHPSVVYFNKPFNGYKYWMAFTPYPLGNKIYENPSIVASNDGINWVVPNGITNPIIPQPAGNAGYFNSDTHLLLDKDGKTLYLSYKTTDALGTRIDIIKSIDGISWSTPKTILANQDSICPIIKWDGFAYNLWTVLTTNTPYTLEKRTCLTPDGVYSNPITCTFPLPAGRYMWHYDIYQYGEEYHMVMQDSLGAYGVHGVIYFAKSTDGITWTRSNEAILKEDYGKWDKFYYKPAIIPFFKNGAIAYRMWYGSNFPKWLIGVTEITFDKTQRKLNDASKLTAGLYGLNNVKAIDIFNRANNAALGNLNSGQPWATVGNSLAIENGKLVNLNGLNSCNVVDTGLIDNYKISVKVNNDAEGFIYFRFTDTGHFYRFGKPAAGGSIELRKYNGGSTALAYELGISNAGDTVTVEIKNNVITCRVNGTLKARVTDSFNASASKCGIKSEVLGASFSNFYVESI